MNIGDSVLIQDIANQSTHRWVVLADLIFSIEGDVEGGTIKYIEDTKIKAGNKELMLHNKGITTLLVCGALEPLNIGEVFVKCVG